MKTLIVREAFSLGAEFFARGTEISDPAVIAQVLESHPGHVLASQQDAETPPAAALAQDPPAQDPKAGKGGAAKPAPDAKP
jgi:hypothetical protein